MDRLKRGQSIVLILTCLLVMMNLFLKTMPSVLSVDFVRDFELSATALSAFSAATMLGFGIMQIPSGVITDFLGGRKTLTCLFLLASASIILFSLTSNAVVAVGARLATGIGIAVTVPGLALLARWFSASGYVRANSVFLTVGSLGPLLASGPLAYAVTWWNWRTVIMASGVFCLLLALAVWCFIPEQPPREDHFEKRDISFKAVADSIKMVARRRIFWVMAIWMACGPGMGMAFSALWWGPYLIQGCGMSQTEAGNTLTLIFLLSMPGMPLLAWLYSSVITNRGILLRLLSLGGMVTIAILMWAAGKNNLPLHVVLGFFFQFTTGVAVTVLYASMRELFPLRIVGTALGCLNTVLPLAAMAVQNLFGFVLDHSSAALAGNFTTAYRSGLWIFMGSMVIAFFATFLMTRPEAAEE